MFGLGFAILLCSSQVALAEKNHWKGEGELGFTQTSGNTETQSLIAKLSLGYKQNSWEHNIELEGLRSEDGNAVTSERYGINLQSNYSLSERNHLFGKGRYEEDRFSGYDYQTSLIGGYGHHFIKNERTDLKIEVGAGVRQSKLNVAGSQADEEGVGFAGLNFSQKIATHSEFTQDFRVEAGSDNIYSESDTGFKVNVTDQVAMKLSVLVQNNSDVPPNTEKTDTITAVTLVYNF